MRYLLDTNTCIAYLNRSNQSIYNNLLAHSPEEVCICDVVKYELYFGAYKSSRTENNLKKLTAFFAEMSSLPFDGKSAELCGKIRAELQAQGTPIGAYDLQIAAITLSHGLTLVTHNTKEFERIGGLSLADWQMDETQM
ncbi:MAG: type II toxin-antitoxin system VapC family toxin [Cyanobacteria bacterium P01_D01_bin.105]